MEDTYQLLLDAYSKEVGPENIGIKWLEYCTFVDFKIEETTGKVTMTFAPPRRENPDEDK